MQVGYVVNAAKAPRQSWISGLFDCCADCGICCYGTFLGSCLYGDNVSKLTGSGCCGPCCMYWLFGQCACCFAGPNRTMMRNKYNLTEEPCGDCCVHCFCGPCAICQEAREIQSRGAQPPQTVVVVTAPTSQTMVMGMPSQVKMA